MSPKGEFAASFRNWLAAVDEAYLIGITNKGTYNRAVKELGDASTVKAQWLAEQIQCTFPDGQTCQLTTDIKTNRCTCPSRSICKHTLMGLLHVKTWLQQQVDSPAESGSEQEKPGAEATQTVPDFSPLLLLTKKDLKKFVTDKVYQDLCYRIGFGVSTRIEESSMLTVQFPDEGITVRFPQHEPVRDAICSCKATDFCRHRVEAVMHYQLFKGTVSAEQLEDTAVLKIAKEPLQHIKRLLEQLVVSGASRLPQHALDQIEQMAVVCHSSDLPNLEKRLRGLQADVSLYVNKHAAASQDILLAGLSALYNTVVAIEQTQDPLLLKKLVGEHKRGYVDVPPLELIGVGAGVFRSKAGFEGITYYFFNEKLQRFLTFTNSRPTYYEGARAGATGSSLQGMYREQAPWGVEVTGAEFSKSRIRLLGGKLSSEGRLSSSEQSTGRLLERIPLREVSFGSWLFDDWKQLLGHFSEQRLSQFAEQEEQDNLFLLRVQEWGTEPHFDEIEQVLYLPILDRHGHTLRLRVPYSKAHQLLTDNVEAIPTRHDVQGLLLGKIDLIRGELFVLPIALCGENGRIENLSLDKREQQKEGSHA